MKKFNLFITSLSLIWVSWAFGFIETWYFGFHVFPKTNEEAVCDGLAFIGSLTGFILLVYIITINGFTYKSTWKKQ